MCKGFVEFGFMFDYIDVDIFKTFLTKPRTFQSRSFMQNSNGSFWNCYFFLHVHPVFGKTILSRENILKARRMISKKMINLKIFRFLKELLVFDDFELYYLIQACCKIIL